MPSLNSIFTVLNSPLVIMIVALLALMLFLRGTRLDVPTLVVSLNSIGSQPFALLVLAIGFWMLVECKKWGIDTTIAGGVIGCGVNMLQAQLKDATHPPPGAAVKTEVKTEFSAPGNSKDDNPSPK